MRSAAFFLFLLLVIPLDGLSGRLKPDSLKATFLVAGMSIDNSERGHHMLLHLTRVELVDEEGRKHRGEIIEPAEMQFYLYWPGLAPGRYRFDHAWFENSLRKDDKEIDSDWIIVPREGGLVFGGWVTVSAWGNDTYLSDARHGSPTPSVVLGDTVAAVRKYQEDDPRSKWAPWLAERIGPFEEAYATTRATEEAEAASAKAQEAAYWDQFPDVTYEELLGILGGSIDDPAAIDVRDRKKNLSEPDWPHWSYDQYTIMFEDGRIKQINIHQTVPGLEMGQTRAEVTSAFGEPGYQTTSEYGDVHF